MPLHLFRNRTFSASMLAIFFATFGFGGADHLPAVLLPHRRGRLGDRVRLPLPAADVRPDPAARSPSGQIVSRTGRYKPVVLAGLAMLIVGQVAPDRPPRGHQRHRAGAPDVRRRPRHRPDLRGLHDHRPERRAVPRARRGDDRPDALPPDRDDRRASPWPTRSSGCNFTWDLLPRAGRRRPARRRQFGAGDGPGRLRHRPADLRRQAAAADFLAQIPPQFQPIFVDGFHRRAHDRRSRTASGSASARPSSPSSRRSPSARSRSGRPWAARPRRRMRRRAERRPPLPAAD